MAGRYQRYRFGTLYLNNIPQKNPKNPIHNGDIPMYDGKSSVVIGDTVQGKEIDWIRPEGINVLVADRVLLSKISWNKLKEVGLVTGRTITIDGVPYTCRLLGVGEERYRLGEWDTLLSSTTTSDAVWHWKNMLFWGQEKCSMDDRSCVVRGFKNFDEWDTRPMSAESELVGYRPVLMPLGAQPAPVGKETVLDGQNFVVVPGTNFKVMNCIVLHLHPIDGNGIENRMLLPDTKEDEIMRMYTLLMDGMPVHQNFSSAAVYKSGAKLELTDAFFGKEFLIPWTVKQGIAHSDRIVLCGIGEETLREQGYL